MLLDDVIIRHFRGMVRRNDVIWNWMARSRSLRANSYGFRSAKYTAPRLRTNPQITSSRFGRELACRHRLLGRAAHRFFATARVYRHHVRVPSCEATMLARSGRSYTSTGRSKSPRERSATRSCGPCQDGCFGMKKRIIRPLTEVLGIHYLWIHPDQSVAQFDGGCPVRAGIGRRGRIRTEELLFINRRHGDGANFAAEQVPKVVASSICLDRLSCGLREDGCNRAPTRLGLSEPEMRVFSHPTPTLTFGEVLVRKGHCRLSRFFADR